MHYCTSPYIVGTWIPHGVLLHNLATDTALTIGGIGVEILQCCSRWQSAEEVVKALHHHDGGEVEQAICALHAAHMLISTMDTPSPAEFRLAEWGAWVPVAAHFHLATRNMQFDLTPPAPREDAGVLSLPGPPAVKQRDARSPVTALPMFDRSKPFARIALERRTWRSFGERPLSLEGLSNLCGLTFAVQHWLTFEGVPAQALKTSPSGGARHSIEAYVCAREIDGLAPGIYHYMPDVHGLARIRDGFTRVEAAAFVAGQDWFAGASALVVMTSVVGRVQARYDHPKAYRNLLIEAGHLAQTFCLHATEMELASFCTAALAESLIETALGVDCLREPALYIVGVGTRPGEGWNPNPFNDVRAKLEPPAYQRDHEN